MADVIKARRERSFMVWSCVEVLDEGLLLKGEVGSELECLLSPMCFPFGRK